MKNLIAVLKFLVALPVYAWIIASLLACAAFPVLVVIGIIKYLLH